MAHIVPILSTVPVTGIAKPHQSTVAGILRAARQGLFTADEADMLIDRVRAHVTAAPITPPIMLPRQVENACPATVSRHTSGAFVHGPDRTFS